MNQFHLNNIASVN